jgi:hypothetical protein
VREDGLAGLLAWPACWCGGLHLRTGGMGRVAPGERLTTSLGERAHPSGSSRPRRADAEVKMSEINLERALDDPADLFENPDAVVRHPTLTWEQKVQILNNWQLDASRLEGSEGEGMRGEDAPMLNRVRIALAALMGQQ